MGLEFVRHIERTRALLFVLDVSIGGVGRQYELLRGEVAQYDVELADRPHLLVLNKMDMVDSDSLAAARRELPSDETIVDISALQRRGLDKLVQEVVLLLDEFRHTAARSSSTNNPANLSDT